MKNKLILKILFVLLIVATFSACRKDVGPSEVQDSFDQSSDQSQQDIDNVDNTNLTVTPTEALTAEPTMVPTNTPTIEPTQEATDTINTTSGVTFSNEEPIPMAVPPFQYYRSDKVKENATNPMKLKLISTKTNGITDDEDWFQTNHLSLPAYQVPNSYQNAEGNLPDGIDKTWNDLIITSAFYDDSYIYCTYGMDFSEGYMLTIYDAKSMKIVYTFDFSNYRFTPDYVGGEHEFIQQKINWAEIKNNILYVSHSHSTYASSSNNKNAYITAIDLSDRSILWRTDALVSNASDFQIIDDVILCGYGFTAEDDYLYQIDRNTGKVLAKTPLKTAAEYIICNNTTLFVRTYNTDYEFDMIKQ